MKKNVKSFLIVTLFFILGFYLIHQNTPRHNLANIKEVKIAGQNIKVELALTDASRQQGLSGRDSLKEDEGLLFVFEDLGEHTFWMKDMNFPIDIIWVGEDLKIVYIKKDARPELYPETYFPDSSKKYAKYVLEVVSGFSEKYNLKEGDLVTFTFTY
jgi:uncharacterized membrane protein (UPF0127 family)